VVGNMPQNLRFNAHFYMGAPCHPFGNCSREALLCPNSIVYLSNYKFCIQLNRWLALGDVSIISSLR
jgi:hypothetical protein